MVERLDYNEKKNFIENIEFKSFKLILKNHRPLATMRPRKGLHGFYIPNDAKNRKIIHNIIMPQIPENIKKNPLMSEIYLKAQFFFPIPKNFTKVDYELAKEGYISPVTKPDLDNVMKTYLDALNKVVWLDDSQVVELLIQKFYTNKEYPYVVLRIKYIDEILVRSIEKSKSKSLVNLNNKEIQKQIIKIQEEINKYIRAIKRFKKEETIQKYENKVAELEKEISALRNKLLL